MGILEAILLGIIQGIAEFLPISSSGHLAIFQKLFGMDEVGISFDVFLHIDCSFYSFLERYFKTFCRRSRNCSRFMC